MYSKYGIVDFGVTNVSQGNLNTILDDQVIFDSMKPLLNNKHLSLLLFDLKERDINQIQQIFNSENQGTEDIDMEIHENFDMETISIDEEDINNETENVDIVTQDEQNCVNNYDSTKLNTLYHEFIENKKYIWPADKQFKAELELLQIHLQHKMPLEAYGTIMSWASRLNVDGMESKKKTSILVQDNLF